MLSIHKILQCIWTKRYTAVSGQAQIPNSQLCDYELNLSSTLPELEFLMC